MKMTPHTQRNLVTWNQLVEQEVPTDHHREVERFQVLGSSLRSIEREELGEVVGRSLLHLQCNMGADTLSWANQGALVTGVDLSDSAIAHAQALATESHIAARFIAADLYQLPMLLNEQFDIVFTSYGVLWWLEHLQRWAEIVASFLKPGGIFYIVDMHPFTNCLAVEDTLPLRCSVVNPYAHTSEPLQVLHGQLDASVRTWSYSIGEVITALIQAGLQVSYLHEHMLQFYQQFSLLQQDEDGWWRWPPSVQGLPLLFSLKAKKP